MSEKQVIQTEGWEMVPHDTVQAKHMAEYIGKSNLCPADFRGKPADIYLAAAMGHKLGLDVFASMQGIAIIKGRPCIWGDVLRSLILSHPYLADLEEFLEGEDENTKAVCIITRKGMTPYRAEFSVKDAKDAGLWGRNTWANFPKDMLLNRAFSRAARRRFADALNGLHVAEEMKDAVVSERADHTAPDDADEEKFSIEINEKAQVGEAEKPQGLAPVDAEVINKTQEQTEVDAIDAADAEFYNEPMDDEQYTEDDGFGGAAQ